MIKKSGTFLMSLSLVLSANAFAYDLDLEYFENEEIALLKVAEQ